jgi:hypothetical protein
MKMTDLEEGVIDMQLLANKAKQLMAKGMSEEQVVQQLVKEGTPRRLAEQAVAAAQMNEAPIANTDDPMDPMIHGHEKANPMNLKGRIFQARKQLQELAQMAESNDLSTWVQITKLAKGGMFMGLEQNLEQIRHGLEELAAKRKKGGVASRGIEKFDEEATAGSTSSGNISVGAVYKNKPAKQAKNKDGTVKNALDMKGGNLLTGGSLKR